MSEINWLIKYQVSVVICRESALINELHRNKDCMNEFFASQSMDSSSLVYEVSIEEKTILNTGTSITFFHDYDKTYFSVFIYIICIFCL